MMHKSKLYCEMSYLEKVADSYAKNGLMYKFFMWLDKLNKKKKDGI